MRKISPEEREMLIVAENFGCVAEVIAELGITAEEAREIIWGEDQERVGKPFFYFGEEFFHAPAAGPAQPNFCALLRQHFISVKWRSKVQKQSILKLSDV